MYYRSGLRAMFTRSGLNNIDAVVAIVYNEYAFNDKDLSEAALWSLPM